MQRKFIFSKHSITQMFNRGISKEYVTYAIENGTTIQYYTDDKPYPSKLNVCVINGRFIHVVFAESEKEWIVITAYEPDPSLWSDDRTKRRP